MQHLNLTLEKYFIKLSKYKKINYRYVNKKILQIYWLYYIDFWQRLFSGIPPLKTFLIYSSFYNYILFLFNFIRQLIQGSLIRYKNVSRSKNPSEQSMNKNKKA